MAELDGEGCDADHTMGPGAIPLWLIGVLFTFLGLAVICDDYFVLALAKISDSLKLSDDVAGACCFIVCVCVPLEE